MAKESIAQLKRLLEQVQRPLDRPVELISTGCTALDRCLPEGGLRRGSLVEWLGTGPGCGVDLWALQAARQAIGERLFWVVLDRQQTFHPPAAAAWGLDLKRLILIRTSQARDEQWALDQALRCAQVGAVLAWPGRLDGRTFRRLQLAAESGGSLGILVRAEQAHAELSWADVRFRVAACGESSVGSSAPAAPVPARNVSSPASVSNGSSRVGSSPGMPGLAAVPLAVPSTDRLGSVSSGRVSRGDEWERFSGGSGAAGGVRPTASSHPPPSHAGGPVASGPVASGPLLRRTAGRTVWRWQVDLLRCRGYQAPTSVTLEIDLWTGAIHEAVSSHLVTTVAHPASAAHSAGA